MYNNSIREYFEPNFGILSFQSIEDEPKLKKSIAKSASSIFNENLMKIACPQRERECVCVSFNFPLQWSWITFSKIDDMHTNYASDKIVIW